MKAPGGTSDIVLFVNGKCAKTRGRDPLEPLVSFVRNALGLKGTKNNCEFGCTGACTVIISTKNKVGEGWKHRAVSSCQLPLAACHGSNITTIEGIGTSEAPHALQTRLAECHAVQCGYDSAGIVVSMFGLLLNRQRPLMEEIEKCLVGNLSRCNGYRAVLEAYRQFAETSNDEREKFEAGLPGLAASQDLEPVRLGSSDSCVRWYSVPSLVWLRTLQTKDPEGAVFFGLPSLRELEGVKTVYDVSRVEVTKRGLKDCLEIPANATISDLIDTLANLEAKVNPGVIKEVKCALESIKTAQYRNSRAVADALKDSFVLRMVLAALDANLSVTENSKSVTLSVREAIQEKKAGGSVLIKTLNLPTPKENLVFLFESVAGRKANGYDCDAGALSLTMESSIISDPVVLLGNWKTGEQKLGGLESLLDGKGRNGSVDTLANKLRNTGDYDIQQKGVLMKLLSDLQNYNAAEEKIQFYRARNTGRKAIQSSQFTEYVHGAEEDAAAPLGKPYPTTQGIDCACGEAVFTEDMPKYERELFFAPVLSPIAHGKIKSVDASAALKVGGVTRFVSIKDVPAGRNKCKVAGLEDEKVFAEDIVEFDGDMIGAILAEDEATARAAAKLVKLELEELKPIVSLEQAMREGKPMELDENEFLMSAEKGNVDEALQNSDRIVNGYIQTPRQEHFYEETNSVLVVPLGERNELDVYVATANQFQAQHTIAGVLMVPLNKINMFTKRVGCSYGGKVAKQLPFYAAVALAAKLENRPVRCRLARDEDMKLIGQRGEFLGKYTVGVKDGKLTGARFKLFKNAGWNSDNSPGIMGQAISQFENCYNFPSMEIDGKIYPTNTASNTAFRGYGAPPALTITENMIFDICAETGYDPLEFRRNNLQEEGYTLSCDQVMTADDVTHKLCLEALIEKCQYHAMKKDVEAFNAANRSKKRGLALIPNKYGIALPKAYGQGACLLNIFMDGTVQLSVTGVELGQGLYVKMIQIASHELGIPMSKIHMSGATNKATPNPIPTGGSTAADLSGNAVKNACQEMLRKLAPIREAMPDLPWEAQVGMAFGSRINLSTTGYYCTPEDRYTFDPATKKGRRWWYFTNGAAFSLVELDMLTGQHTLLKTNIIVDVGESINPAIDVSQIEAAFMQGYGYLAMEDTLFDDQGKLISRGHDEYNMPSIADCPSEFNVALLKGNKREKHLLYSSKGIGEPPFFSGASVFFAVKDALLTASREAGNAGTVNLEAPCTPRNVLKAIQSF